MKLDEYLKKTGQSQSDFGLSLDPPVSQALVSQWINGATRITLDRAIEMRILSNGEVSVDDCANMYADKVI